VADERHQEHEHAEFSCHLPGKYSS
jgi:hypothetical protein